MKNKFEFLSTKNYLPTAIDSNKNKISSERRINMSYGHKPDVKHFQTVSYNEFGGLKKSIESLNTKTPVDKKHNQRLTFAKQQIISFRKSCEISYPRAFLQTLV